MGSEYMICLRCGGKTHVEFNHNVEINSYDYCFIDEIPLKDRNIKNVKCYRCFNCGDITINQYDLREKIILMLCERKQNNE
jgi:hypothetical protein